MVRLGAQPKRLLLSISTMWVCYSIYIAIRNEEWNLLGQQLTDAPMRSILNLATLILFLATCNLAHLLSTRRVIVIMASIASVYSGVSLLQAVGNEWANSLPEYFVSNEMELQSVEAAVNTKRFVRARALDQYVHKYSAYQGIFSAIILAHSLLTIASKNNSKRYSFLSVIGAILAILGVISTFSRSPIYAMIIISIGVAVYLRKFHILMISFGLVVGAIYITIPGEFSSFLDDEMYQRLLVVDFENSNDGARLSSWVNSLNSFVTNPIFGNGSLQNSNFELVTHNVPLRVLGDFGLIGFSLYVSIWFLIIKCSLVLLRSGFNNSSNVGIIAIAGFFAALFDCSFHSSGLLQRDVAQAAILGACVGMCFKAFSAQNHSKSYLKT